MAQEDVESVKAAYEAFGRGDLEGAAANFTEDVEWWSSDEIPNGGRIVGKAQVVESWSKIPENWSEFSVQPDEFIDGGDKVIVLGTQRGRSTNGGSFESPFAHVLWSSGGKVSRAQFHTDSAQGVKALGG
jgi:ketosteroid isomerase-like protein